LKTTGLFERIILRELILNRMWGCGLHLTSSEYYTEAEYCVYCNEPSGSTKNRKHPLLL